MCFLTFHTGSVAASPGVEVEEISPEQGRSLLAPRVRDLLGISLDEFLERLDAGQYSDTRDDNILRLVMLAPLAR